MTEDELRDGVRRLLSRYDLSEGRVLAGTGFFVDGRLVVAVIGAELCLRLDESHKVARSDISLLHFAGRPVPGWAVVDGDQLDDDSLASWVNRGLEQLAPRETATYPDGDEALI